MSHILIAIIIVCAGVFAFFVARALVQIDDMWVDMQELLEKRKDDPK